MSNTYQKNRRCAESDRLPGPEGAGQAGAWAVTGVGLCITLLGSAAVITWQLHRA